MKKKFRIKKNNDFKSTISKHNILKCGNILIFYKKNSNNDYIRVGISITSKIKGSVIRNKIKRQMRAIVDKIIDFNKKIGVDIIFLVKSCIENFHCMLKMLSEKIEIIYSYVKNI